MGLAELTHSQKWKSTMNYFYSIGASIVLLGALFKLQHWPYGGAMLTIGMSCEALIFFLSAFEPIHEIPDWTRVYPQLSPDYDGEIVTELPVRSSHSSGMDQFWEKADITPEMLDKLRKGIQDLTNATKGIAEISSATIATEMYVKNIVQASESVNAFSHVNLKASQNVERSYEEIVHACEKSSKIINDSSKEMADNLVSSTNKLNQQLSASSDKLTSSYKDFTDHIQKEFNSLNENSKSYSSEIQKVNAQVASMNASYELHLQNLKKITDASGKSTSDFTAMQSIMNETIEEARNYKKQTEQMNKNLESLNQVYGNMLGAMNIKG